MKVIKGLKKPKVNVLHYHGHKVGYSAVFENGYQISITNLNEKPDFKSLKDMLKENISEYMNSVKSVTI